VDVYVAQPVVGGSPSPAREGPGSSDREVSVIVEPDSARAGEASQRVPGEAIRIGQAGQPDAQTHATDDRACLAPGECAVS
jgi:hypothetical protein